MGPLVTRRPEALEFFSSPSGRRFFLGTLFD